MSTKIEPAENGQYFVNGKLVYKDQNGNWVAGEELLPSEARAFREHLQAIERGFDPDCRQASSPQPPEAVEPEGSNKTYKV